jgi:hypothetical protein
MRSLTQIEGKSGVLSYGLYKMYKERFSQYGPKYDANVGWQQWLRICKRFNHLKMESILKGYVFAMPYKLGSIGIIQYRRRIRFDDKGELIKTRLIIDWDKTLKLWKMLYPDCETRADYKKIKNKQLVYQTNEHTDGRIFRFHWKKKYSNVTNISAYELNVPDQYKYALCRRIKENNNVQYCTKF